MAFHNSFTGTLIEQERLPKSTVKTCECQNTNYILPAYEVQAIHVLTCSMYNSCNDQNGYRWHTTISMTCGKSLICTAHVVFCCLESLLHWCWIFSVTITLNFWQYMGIYPVKCEYGSTWSYATLSNENITPLEMSLQVNADAWSFIDSKFCITRLVKVQVWIDSMLSLQRNVPQTVDRLWSQIVIHWNYNDTGWIGWMLLIRSLQIYMTQEDHSLTWRVAS